MAETLSEMFAAAQSPVVEWRGGLVYGLYEFAAVPESLCVEFIASKQSPVQGLKLKMRGGLLVVNETEAANQLLWTDTAPDRLGVQVRVDNAKRAVLKVWNVWRGGTDVTHAWMGNSGMRVEKASDGHELLLRCSDGVGAPSFDDLEVRLLLG